MRKQTSVIVFFTLLAFLAIPIGTSSAKEGAPETKYLQLTMGVVVQNKSNNDILSIEKDIFDAFKEKYATDIKQVIFSDISALRKRISENKIDLFACWNTDCDVEFHKNTAYAPMFITTAFDAVDINLCLVTGKNITPDTAEALKKKTIIINGDKFSYYSLRKLIGVSPYDYFSRVGLKPDTMSNIYAVSMGAYDATFVNSGSLKVMGFVNPGPLKMIKKTVCGEPYKSPAVYASKKLDPALKEKIMNDMVAITSNPRTAKKNPEYKEFWPMLTKYAPLIIQTKAKFTPVNENDYENVYRLFKEAEKKGWEKDYNDLKRIVVEN